MKVELILSHMDSIIYNNNVIGDSGMEWIDYMIIAAQHSKGNAGHWFRYLRKYIDKYGSLFSENEVRILFQNPALTPFQRVSLKAAFLEGSPTRLYIQNLNKKRTVSKIHMVREKYEGY